MYISYQADGFTPALGLNKSTSLAAPLSGLLWAAATVGYSPVSRSYWAGHGAFHVMSRMAAVLGGLSADGGRWGTTWAYTRLESTERAWQTYALGMAVAKWVCASEFDIHWLLHLSQAPWDMVFGSNQRPDLVGWGANTGWCVAEAKGRQRGNVATSLTQAKAQVLAVKSVNGSAPLSLAIATKFTRASLECRVLDPLAEGEGSIEFSEDLFLTEYYRPTYELIAGAVRAEAPQTSFSEAHARVYLNALDVWLGMRRSLYEDMRAERPMSFEQFAGLSRDETYSDVPFVEKAEGATVFSGLDGISVALGPGAEALLATAG